MAEFTIETNYPSNTNYLSEMDKLFVSSINSANDQGPHHCYTDLFSISDA